ncbi:YetF domain-containing protein [Variovorax humicola]|uniref:YetF domain-containing protein n=1 Tax=Variovorax humicola TaxID=1769758 RepID=A0ABU8WAZ6_9BURK
MTDFTELFAREFSVWHMVVRGTVVYWFLLLVFRFVLRRDVGSMGVADLLFVVLVADAASNAMQGEYKSISDGLVLLTTLIAWNFGLDWLSYRFAWFAKFLEPQPEVLVRHGRVNRKAMKREMITMEELEGKLREGGVESLSQVRIARLESDGKLSVFTVDGRKPGDDVQESGPPGR